MSESNENLSPVDTILAANPLSDVEARQVSMDLYNNNGDLFQVKAKADTSNIVTPKQLVLDASKISIHNGETVVISDVSGKFSVIESGLAQELVDRANADTTLQTNIEEQAGRIDTLLHGTSVDLNTLQEIVDAYQLKDTQLLSTITTLQGVDTTLQAGLAQELVDRANADNTLQDNINAEVLNRTNADNTLQDNINAEVLNRTNADTALQDNINAEVLNRTNADTALQANIDSEEAARQADVAALQSDVVKLATALRELQQKFDSVHPSS